MNIHKQMKYITTRNNHLSDCTKPEEPISSHIKTYEDRKNKRKRYSEQN